MCMDGLRQHDEIPFSVIFLLTALHCFPTTTYFMYKSWTETFALHEQGYFLRQHSVFPSFLHCSKFCLQVQGIMKLDRLLSVLLH